MKIIYIIMKEEELIQFIDDEKLKLDFYIDTDYFI